MGCGASTEPPKDKGPAPGQTEAEETPTAGEDAVADLPNVGPPSSPAAVARAERVTANATTADMRPAGRNSVTPEMIKRRNEHHETSSMVKRASQTGSLPWFYDVVREATVDQASCYEPLVEAPFEKRKACTDFYQLLFSATKPMTEDLPIERMIEEVRSLDSSERERFLIEWAYQTNRVRLAAAAARAARGTARRAPHRGAPVARAARSLTLARLPCASRRARCARLASAARRRQVGNVLLMSSVAQSGLDLDLTIQNVTMALQSILRCTHCTFFVREDDDTPGGPRLFTTYPNRAQFTTVRFPMSGIVGRALTDGQSRVIDSPVTDDAFDKAVDLGLRGAVPSDAGAGPSGAERAALPSSMMVLPLLDDRGVAFGVILALDKLGDRAFDESDLVTAQTMLNTSRAHILFTLEHKAIVKSQEEAAMVLDTAKLFSSEIKVERLAHIVMSRAKELTHAERACLFLVEPEKRELVLFVLPRGEEFDEESVGEAQELDLRLPLTAGMVGHAASSGEVLNIPSAYEDERFSDDPDLVAIDAEIGGRTQSVLCVPIRSREGTTVGVVQMLNKKRAAHVRRLETQLAIGSKSRTSFAAAPTPTTPALEPQSPCSTHSNSDAARPRMRIPAMAAVHRSTLVGGLNVSNMSASQMAVATQRVSQRISRNFAEQGGGAELPSDLSDYITFTDDDVHVVEALGAQAAIALENSMLYRKSVEQQHFLEGVMHSLDSIVLTFDRAGLLKSVNQKQSESASSFLNIRWKGWVGRHYSEWLAERNKLLCDNMRSCYEHHTSVSVFDYEFKSAITSALVNVKMVPLKDYAGEASGVVVMLEEQGAQQRLTAALTRYMPPDRVAAYVEHDFDPKARHMTGKTQRVAIVHLNVRAPSTFGFSGASVFAAKGHDPVQSLKVMNEASMHIGKAILKEEVRPPARPAAHPRGLPSVCAPCPSAPRGAARTGPGAQPPWARARAHQQQLSPRPRPG